MIALGTVCRPQWINAISNRSRAGGFSVVGCGKHSGFRYWVPVSFTGIHDCVNLPRFDWDSKATVCLFRLHFKIIPLETLSSFAAICFSFSYFFWDNHFMDSVAEGKKAKQKPVHRGKVTLVLCFAGLQDVNPPKQLHQWTVSNITKDWHPCYFFFYFFFFYLTAFRFRGPFWVEENKLFNIERAASSQTLLVDE